MEHNCWHLALLSLFDQVVASEEGIIIKTSQLPFKVYFCLLASHLREAKETEKKNTPTVWTLQV